MVKLNFNCHAVGFSQIGTIQLEVTDWEGDTLAAELTLPEAATLAKALVKAFQQVERKPRKAKRHKILNK